MLTTTAFIRATITNFFFFASLNGYVLLPLHIQALGGTEVEIGIVMGIYSGVGILCQPLVGPWVDAVGRKPFMVLGVGLVALSSLIAVLVPAVGVLALVRAVQGVGFSAFFVANFSYVIDLVPPARRGWALGIYGVSGLASTALAPLLGEWIIRRFGFRPLFVVSLMLALVAMALVHGVREHRRGEQPPVRGVEWLREGLVDVFQRHMTVAVFFGLGSGTVFAFLPTFAEALGVTTLALFYTAYAGAAMVVRVFGGRLIDTRGRRAVIVPSMFVQAGAAAILAGVAAAVTRTSRVPVAPFLAVAGLLSGGAHGFVYPGLAALVADRAPEARRAAVVGVFSAVFLVGQTAGAFAFGYVAHALGYAALWTILTSLLVLGSLLSFGLAGERAA
ncbi:MAG: MFS transporter [Candidatus Rokubacteria bacterium]|nr:MFS transporter [Candidatus Rokubacteria bacterium]